MAELPAYHWRTHLPGGTDPVPISLPFAQLSNGGTNQTVTTTDELSLSQFDSETNDVSVFRVEWDGATFKSPRLLILQPGLYFAAVTVNVISASIGVNRSVYLMHNSKSYYDLNGAPFGSAWGEGFGSFLGTGQNYTGVAERSTGGPNKSSLYYSNVGTLFGSGADPGVVSCAVTHTGTDYTIGNLDSVLTVVRLSATTGAAIPGLT